ncbi:MAG: hypothetical protein ACRCUE_01855 [Bosea sp. (in: a-proteobacteria)]
MNRIVKEHYPVEKLPEDLRVGLNPRTRVTVTVIEETDLLTQEPALMSATDAFLELVADVSSPKRSREEIDAWVRSLRDE